MKEVNVLFVLFHITEHKPITDLQSTAIHLVKFVSLSAKHPTGCVQTVCAHQGAGLIALKEVNIPVPLHLVLMA